MLPDAAGLGRVVRWVQVGGELGDVEQPTQLLEARLAGVPPDAAVRGEVSTYGALGGGGVVERRDAGAAAALDPT